MSSLMISLDIHSESLSSIAEYLLAIKQLFDATPFTGALCKTPAKEI